MYNTIFEGHLRCRLRLPFRRNYGYVEPKIYAILINYLIINIYSCLRQTEMQQLNAIGNMQYSLINA